MAVSRHQYAIAAMSVRMPTSAGPVIFRKVRVGRDEKPFVCYKLRTMYVDTQDAAPQTGWVATAL